MSFRGGDTTVGCDHRVGAASRELSPPPSEGPGRNDQPGLPDGRRGPPFADPIERESYIIHPLAVARIVADIGLHEISLAAALLHDAVEDTEITLADVEANFGSEVATIVDGVTKLERIQFHSREAQQAATMRKMLVAMARDIRVLVIKLADRLHNMRTLAAMPDEKQQRVAQETLDIYAPLAHRLGFQEIKQQLEDLSFAALHPKRLPSSTPRRDRSPEREVYLAQAVAEVRARLDELSIDAEVTGRGKHLWSIYEKMVVKAAVRRHLRPRRGAGHRRLDQGLIATLGYIHGRGDPSSVGSTTTRDAEVQPVPELAHDGHRSGRQADRRPDPHTRDAPAGRAGSRRPLRLQGRTSAGDMDWLNRIIDWQAEVSDPAQFMQNLKPTSSRTRSSCSPRRGRWITLPIGSTTVDFAYAVHTEVGHTLHRRQDQWPPRVARPRAHPAATHARSSRRRSRRPVLRRTGSGS